MASKVGALAAERVGEHAGDLHIPHLAVIETASVLRAWVQRGAHRFEQSSARGNPASAEASKISRCHADEREAGGDGGE